MKILLAVAVLLASSANAFAQNNPVKLDADPQQAIDVKYRLFKTENVFTFLLLDTSSGKVWQAQFSIDEKNAARIMVPINDRPLGLAGETSHVGRFTLYPTSNMYNFMLLDQDTGRLFQCQWSLKGNQMLLPIEPFPEDAKKG